MRPLVILSVLFFGCDPIEPATELAQLVEARVEAPAESTPVSPTPQAEPDATPDELDEPANDDGFDFDADAPMEDTDGPTDPTTILEGLGIDPPAEAPIVAEDGPTLAEPTLEPEPMVSPGFNPDASRPAPWTPDQPVALTGAVRLISTTARSQPPRAILGLADGSEVVVEPGTMLPAENLVVLAVGQDAVQVAEFAAEGDRVRMSSRMLQALYRQGPTDR